GFAATYPEETNAIKKKNGSMIWCFMVGMFQCGKTRWLVSADTLQMSQVLSDGHRPQVGRGAGRRNRAIAHVGLRHSLTVGVVCSGSMIAERLSCCKFPPVTKCRLLVSPQEENRHGKLS
ncbi:MAG: hypothetical protein QGF59_18240, partial [Pirellulaceae bacterium]|nr:hypothetical protein [Pirellulaceae bacterium]